MPEEYYKSLQAAAQRWKAYRKKGYISDNERQNVLLPVKARWIDRLCEVENNCLAGFKRFDADFARRKEREGAFQQLGDYNLWRSWRCALAKRLFRRAAIKIAKRGGFWRYDEDSEKLEEWSQ